MANIFVPPRRNVLPNFRRFSDTVGLGELAPAGTGTNTALRGSLDDLLQAWRLSKSIGLAGDILGAALVLGSLASDEVEQAARFVVSNQDASSSLLVRTASAILWKGPQAERDRAPRLRAFLESNQKRETYQRIRGLKQAVRCFGNDPVTYVELARLYMLVANADRATHCMRIALALAPSNRFVLRCAARMHVHFGDQERAFDILRRNPSTLHDPWLASAHLAIGTLIGRQRSLVKGARSLLSTEGLSAASTAELSAGLGSIELLDGDRRRSKQLFKQALARPNDNALAQTEWALSLDRLFDFDPQDFDVLHNYEALALEAFNRSNWDDAIRHCELWLMDTPFARRAAMMASHVATVALEEYELGQMFCRAGLISHPRDPQLTNNLAYALALGGKPEEALETLGQANIELDDTDTNRACLMATNGLACFRGGMLAEGRDAYSKAIEMAGRVNPTLRRVALLNYAREELVSGQTLPAAVADSIKQSSSPVSAPVRMLESRVLQLLETARAPVDS